MSKTSFPPDLWSTANCSLREILTASTSNTSPCPSFSCLSESSSTNQSQSSTHHQNTHTSQAFPTSACHKRPIKSAMRRSSSNYNNYNKSLDNQIRNRDRTPFHTSQHIPSGLAGGSIVMPTGGGMQQQSQSSGQQHPAGSNTGNNVNGYISPQYGWYISMTPPSPTHYHDSSSLSSSPTKRIKDGQQFQQHQQLQQQQQQQQINGRFHQHNNGKLPAMMSSTTTTSTQVIPMPVGPPKRPVFTRNLKGIPNNTSGWPSVPL